MMTDDSRDALAHDGNTVILSPHRNSCAIECTGPTKLLNRAGVTTRQWDHRRRRFLFPVGDVPRVIARAEADCRVVLIDQDGSR